MYASGEPYEWVFVAVLADKMTPFSDSVPVQ